MTIELAIELIRTSLGGVIILALLFHRNHSQLKDIFGWNYFIVGFCLVFIGMMIDITDNFPELNQFIILGSTPYQSVVVGLYGYLLGFGFIAIGIWTWIPRMLEAQEQNKRALEQKEKELHILSGLLPICANCKNIRDEKEVWTPLETYICDHSEAEFSHGICPACMAKLYPEEESRA